VKEIKLKNANESVFVDDHVFEYLTNDPYLKSIKFTSQLRRHSSGCAFFQKASFEEDKSYKTKTIYLHKHLAEKFLADTKTAEKKLVSTHNGNKLDCRLENLVYRSRSVASRQRKTTSETGYTGVYFENSRYRAVISNKGKTMHLGMYDTAEQAAAAYNQKSLELFGADGKQNIIKKN
jgi:hypothetical protein